MPPKKPTATPPEPAQQQFPTPLGHLTLIAAWLLPYFVTVPSHLNTIITATLTVYVGCWRSVKTTAPTESMTTQVCGAVR